MLIFDYLIDMIFYPVGRILLPLITLGRARAEPLIGPIRKFNMFGYRRDDRGRIVFETSFTAVIGFAACLIVIFLVRPLIKLFS